MADDITEIPTGAGSKEATIAAGEIEAPFVEQFQKAAGLGRQIVGEVRNRDNLRLTPYFDMDGFPGDYVSFLAKDPDEEDITPEDISNAKTASFSIALEAAAQIAEAQPPRSGMVREDTDSLRRLGSCMVGGDKLRQDLMSDSSDVATERMRRVVARRLHKSPYEVEMTKEQLDAWSKDQFQKASGRMHGAAQALQPFFRR